MAWEQVQDRIARGWQSWVGLIPNVKATFSTLHWPWSLSDLITK